MTLAIPDVADAAAVEAMAGGLERLDILVNAAGIIRRADEYELAVFGIVQLTKSLAIGWAADGIRVNAVAPGWIATPLTQALRDDPARGGDPQAHTLAAVGAADRRHRTRRQADGSLCRLAHRCLGGRPARAAAREGMAAAREKAKLWGKKRKLSDRQQREPRRMYGTGHYLMRESAELSSIPRPTFVAPSADRPAPSSPGQRKLPKTTHPQVFRGRNAFALKQTYERPWGRQRELSLSPFSDPDSVAHYAEGPERGPVLREFHVQGMGRLQGVITNVC